MRTIGNIARAAAIFVAATTMTAMLAPIPQAAASSIKYIVNSEVVTDYDIQRRAAFLRLQRRGGNLQQQATEEMIEQVLRKTEIKRLSIDVTDARVDDAYARFAGSNNLTTDQLDQVLAQAGVTEAHFREYIRSQMGWSQALQLRTRSGGGMTEQDVVRRMLEQGGEKPVATEYMLQQVIFVVPASERGAKLATRKREAEAMRQRFQNCQSTRQFAQGLIDVTVRELGRVLEPELPPEWKDMILRTETGSATPVRETDRGVEFIGICSAREVSDDRVAQMVFRMEDGQAGGESDLSETYTKELRDRATIVER